MPTIVLLFVLLVGLLPVPAWSQTPTISENPSWIWGPTMADGQRIGLRREFEVSGTVKRAILLATADNHCEVLLNGKRVSKVDDWNELGAADATRSLSDGRNVLALSVTNDEGIAGALAALVIQYEDGKQQEIVTDGSWKSSTGELRGGGWRNIGFDDSKWTSPQVLGKLGDPKLAWSGSHGSDAIALALAGSSSGEFKPITADNAQAPEGFKIEKIFQVPRTMGSWVALTVDPQGRLIASDQGGAGLFLISPGSGDTPTRVEKLPVGISGAQGLLWAFDSLYAVVNGGPESGLHRMRDTNGDGLVDSDEFCMSVPGGGEHGPHGVILSPDGKSLIIAAGNHTKLPDAITGSQMPRNWNEDHLLPRRWDANGHAAGILAPGGWFCQVDPTGKQWKVISMGYRNQYDMALNADGELFSYDSDMEWDFGSPWYRPTRVCHVTSGSEFGWRSGTGTWPPYYEDSLPPAVEIGPGSPTGVLFGTGARFPARYQKALFILDWTYSTIYSVDLQPSGSSYVGKRSDFITGSPLPVTDAVIGSDGVFYFAAGGRGTQSSLYRVTYVGNESTAPADGHDAAGEELRQLRHQLEALHGSNEGDVDLCIKHLGHEDRFIRFAARVALENQPIAQWRDKVSQLKDAPAVIQTAIALAHQGEASDLPRILRLLNRIDLKSTSENELLGALRAYQVAFARLGQTSDTARQELIKRFDGLYPAKSYFVNAELVQLLVYLESPTVIEKTLALMDTLGPEPKPDWDYLISRNAGYGGTVGKMLEDMPPVRGIHFAFVLRNVKSGWSMPQRQKYFQFLIDAAKHPGGNSYGKFLVQFRDDAIATCSQAEKIVLEPLINAPLVGETFVATAPVGPGRKWSTTEVASTIGSALSGRDFKRGQNLFHATSCARCHRLAGEGGAIGPDLSTAGKKFSIKDMAEAIVEPSKIISDQYGSQQVVLADGKILVGRAVEIGNQFYIYTVDASGKPVVLEKEDVESVQPSKLSQMPVGLIDTLNEEELKDLFAYIMSAGDPKAQVYK